MDLNLKRSYLGNIITTHGVYTMVIHHFQAYFDRKHKKRKTLQMLALSGVVRPSHVELRYTMPLLRVEGPTDSFQNTPGPPTTQSSLLRQFVELMRRLVMDLQSLRTYLHLTVSSFCVKMGSRAHTPSVEPSTTALVVSERNGYAAMQDGVHHGIVESRTACDDRLKQWVRGKIQVQLQQVLEEEVATFFGRVRHRHRDTVPLVQLPAVSRDANGTPHQRSVMGGTVTVLHPRVRDLAERFENKVLPLLTRPPREAGNMLPDLYVQKLSTGDFDEALRSLLSDGAPLSASSIQRLKTFFQLESEAWRKRDLSDLAVIYWWADGLYIKAGIEDRKTALLTIVGTLVTGERIVLACESGNRESKRSWLKLLLDLKHRGLTFPQLTVADGRLGLWAALGEIHPSGEKQGCWNHKIANVLNALPKKSRPKASELLEAMPCAETQTDCERLRDTFVRRYRKTGGKAVAMLLRDWARMVTFYAFPKEHWRYLRTTNIVVSPFDSMQLRTNASRRYKRVKGAKVIMWKLLRVAEKSWRKLQAPELLPLVASSVPFKDGVMTQSEALVHAANPQPEKTAA